VYEGKKRELYGKSCQRSKRVEDSARGGGKWLKPKDYPTKKSFKNTRQHGEDTGGALDLERKKQRRTISRKTKR